MAKKTKNIPLPTFEENDWKKEWNGMPEFEMQDLSSFRKIVIHFRCAEDVAKFAKLIGQVITPKQKALWFPEMPPRRYAHLVYVDDTNES